MQEWGREMSEMALNAGAADAMAAAGESAGDSARRIDVMSLYPHDMNIYGDSGNVLVVMRRLALYGYQPVLHAYNQGDSWPEHIDIVLGGGGQDSGQRKIQDDFMRRADQLRALAEEGVPMLVVCGLYQLFGKYFETIEHDRIAGIGIFDAVTIGKKERLIGNIVEKSTDFGTLVGYENHSGQTYLSGSTQPLAQVISGVGNNAEDHAEGARVKNVIGTYVHGSLLPKNPSVADFLIEQAAIRRYGEFAPQSSDADRVELQRLNDDARRAREVASKRPR